MCVLFMCVYTNYIPILFLSCSFCRNGNWIRLWEYDDAITTHFIPMTGINCIPITCILFVWQG